MAADVNSNLASWSTSEASNSPSGSTAISTNLDDNLRQIQATVRKYLATKGSDLASGTTTDLSTTDGNFVDITGTTTITGFGTLSAGMWKVLQFDGALTLTHNATSLILPGAANITTAAGDCLFAYSLGSGNWIVPFYQPKAGYVTLTGTQTLTNKTLTSPTITNATLTATSPTLTSPVLNTAVTGTAIASVGQMQTGTATDVLVTPGRQSSHYSAAKAWVNFNGTGTVAINGTAYNVTSITDNGTGDYTVNFTSALTDANYAVSVMALASTTGDGRRTCHVAGTEGTGPTTKSTTACRIVATSNTVSGAFADNANISFIAFGI